MKVHNLFGESIPKRLGSVLADTPGKVGWDQLGLRALNK